MSHGGIRWTGKLNGLILWFALFRFLSCLLLLPCLFLRLVFLITLGFLAIHFVLVVGDKLLLSVPFVRINALVISVAIAVLLYFDRLMEADLFLFRLLNNFLGV